MTRFGSPADSTSAPPGDELLPSGAGPRNGPILIVDDEMSVLRSVRRTLRAHGFDNVLICGDGREALELLRRQEVSLVLLDLNMPHLRGEEVLAEVSRLWPELPVIVISADHSASRCIELGAFDYLLKPVAGDRLVATVQRTIEHGLLEARFRQAQKLAGIGLLAGGVAHDLNNMFQCILGHMDLARAFSEDGTGLRCHLDQAQKATARARDLVHQLLIFSGKGQANLVPVCPNEVVHEIVDLLHTVTSGVTRLQVELGPEVPPVRVDVTRLRQVILNLVVNASQAMGEAGGTVTVRTGRMRITEDGSHHRLRPGLHAFLEVSDEGCGMSESVRSRIFEPFFTTKREGTGLGLAAVPDFLRRHRGAVEIESVPGRGTTIRILLPVRPPRQTVE